MKSQLLAAFTLLLLGCQLALSQTNGPIPWDKIGAKAGAGYQGDGLAVSAIAVGAHLRCVFQRLEGDATPEGLWLTSTVSDQPGDRFRVTAMAVGRSVVFPLWANLALQASGAVAVEDKLVRFTRPWLIEEYSVGMDGMRQDFVVPERPAGGGELRVELAVTGATAETRLDGVRLILARSGRKLNYGCLKVTDAAGRELSARMEVADDSDSPVRASDNAIAVVVDDSGALYPLRIDPTFSDADWISLGGLSGANGVVRAAAVDATGNLYIGGRFTIVGNTFATNIAKWDGDRWIALGLGVSGGGELGFPEVNALAVSGGDLYAGGLFTKAGEDSANSVAKWNGSHWSPLAEGMGIGDGLILPVVYALAVSGGNLYAGGVFTTAGKDSANSIAKWDGSKWSALAEGMANDNDSIPPVVFALAVSGSDLYAGGRFTKAGKIAANSIAKWDGIRWDPLAEGVNSPVAALAVVAGDLYAGGGFTMAGGTEVAGIAKWNASGWVSVGSGVNGSILSLTVSGSDLYAGGQFTMAGASKANNIARWNGNDWTALGAGISGDAVLVYALAVSGSSVFAGGQFPKAGDIAANNIAKWNTTEWSVPGSGVGGLVNALAVSGADVFAAGTSLAANSAGVGYIARWDGSNWRQLGTAMGVDVRALTVAGDDLYAGGTFAKVGGISANRVAKWNGSNWSALGSGVNGIVSALKMLGGDLYAGGDFTIAGGVPVRSIARWDGANWSALGEGANGPVSSLVVSGNDLYVGGSFTMAGGIPANCIAKWNGTNWSALGSGVNGKVSAIAVWDGEVFVGGFFRRAGGSTAERIAKWNGSQWSPLGSGMNGLNCSVRALVASGNELYAGGVFTTAGIAEATNIAKWNGSSWSALGSGVGPPADYPYDGSRVNSLAVSGDGALYVGGAFATAGRIVSAYAAKATIGEPALHIDSPGFSDGQFHFTLTGPAGATAVISASNDLQTWTPLATKPLTDGSLQFTDAAAQDFPPRFYRAALQP